MDRTLNRRGFLGLASSATCSAAGAIALANAYPRPAIADEARAPSSAAGVVPFGFPRQDLNAVREVVGASHTQLERVKVLVTQRPALAKASWDWGFGDWESALGAASHTGRRDIAELLIEHGARPDIFTHAMLGDVATVRGMVEALPGIQRTPGPHGITLLQHARNRLRQDLTDSDKRRVTAVADYLESLGDADQTPAGGELTDAEKQIYFGNYAYGGGADEVLVVSQHQRGWLTISRTDESPRRLYRVEPHAFAPAGAPSVRIRFDVTNDQATTVTVHDPEPIVKGVRA